MKRLILLPLLFLSACSTQVIEMTEQPTQQQYDLTDAESDGVIGARDKCPDTPIGALINNDGCETESVDTVRRHLAVNFENDSYVVTDQYFPEIGELAEFMTEYLQTKVTIEGHTSMVGSAEYNQVLSENRAEAIKLILIEQFSIAAERITAVGYGFEQLLIEGDDETAHAQNRRIVADLSIDESYTDMKWNIYSVDEVVE